MAGRVIVDAYGYYQTNNMVKPQLRQLVSPEEDDAQDDSSNRNSSSSSEIGEENDCDAAVAGGPDMTVPKSLNKAIARCEVLDSLTDDQCLLATPWLRGLDLKTKEWGTSLTL